MKSRTKARRTALQVLYEIDLTNHPLGQVLEERLQDNALDDEQFEFTQTIVTGVHQYSTLLDKLIAQNAPEWPLDQVAVIDRNILRIALWEVAIYRKTPLKVGINEAVELGKLFGTDSSARFINGVLGSLAEKLEEITSSLDDEIK